MRVVVTGGSGQLGTLVLERLVATRSVTNIVSLDLVPPTVPSPRIDWRIGDMRDPGLERHLEGADALVHLAFIVTRRASVETMRAVNVEGSKRIFEAAAQHGIKRIVYASSVGAYGMVPGQPSPVVESTPRKPSPSLTYADNKYEVEEFLDAFEANHPETAIVRLRPGLLLGRRIAHVSDGFLKRRVMPVFGDARGPIVWDEDVADAVLLGLSRDVRGAFNLAATDPLTGEELARLAGFRVVRVPEAAVNAAARASSVMDKVLGEQRLDIGWLTAAQIELIVSPERARTELGWKPRYPTSGDVAIALGKQTRSNPDPRITFFLSMVPRLAKMARGNGDVPSETNGMKLSIHVDVTGPRGEDFALSLDQGVIALKRGIPRPPDATVTLTADTFLELLNGTTDPVTANMIGKIRVRGEPLAGAVLTALITGFRRATEATGMQGRVARGLSRWFGDKGQS
jgi:UDP-glucose 4-epimerase